MQRIECVTRAFMDQASVDIEQGFVFFLDDDMTVPHLVE